MPRSAGAARDLLLRARHPLERHLEPEIAARDHDRVARVRESRRGARAPAAARAWRSSGTSAPWPSAISCRARRRSAAVCTKLSATMSTPSDRPNFRSSTSFGVIADVGSAHARRVDALVLAELAALDHASCWISVPSAGLDAQLDAAVGEQQAIAGLHALREPVECRGDPARLRRRTSPVAMRERVAGLRARSGGRLRAAGADLRAAKILEDRHLAVRAFGRRPHAGERGRVRLVRAVREVQAEDVGAGGDQRVEHRRRCRSRGRPWR